MTKVEENRLRNMAARQGLVLERSRRRDRFARGYGTYRLTLAGEIVAGSRAWYGLTLEDVAVNLRQKIGPGREPAYWNAAIELLTETGVAVRRYRASTTGVAFTRSQEWWIDAPVPRGPVAFATLAHEVGHQLKHRSGSRPRWREEIEAWDFALWTFERYRLPLGGRDLAVIDAEKAVRYSLGKALRRGANVNKLRAGCEGWHHVLDEAEDAEARRIARCLRTDSP